MPRVRAPVKSRIDGMNSVEIDGLVPVGKSISRCKHDAEAISGPCRTARGRNRRLTGFVGFEAIALIREQRAGAGGAADIKMRRDRYRTSIRACPAADDSTRRRTIDYADDAAGIVGRAVAIVVDGAWACIDARCAVAVIELSCHQPAQPSLGSVVVIPEVAVTSTRDGGEGDATGTGRQCIRHARGVWAEVGTAEVVLDPLISGIGGHNVVGASDQKVKLGLVPECGDLTASERCRCQAPIQSIWSRDQGSACRKIGEPKIKRRGGLVGSACGIDIACRHIQNESVKFFPRHTGIVGVAVKIVVHQRTSGNAAVASAEKCGVRRAGVGAHGELQSTCHVVGSESRVVPHVV